MLPGGQESEELRHTRDFETAQRELFEKGAGGVVFQEQRPGNPRAKQSEDGYLDPEREELPNEGPSDGVYVLKCEERAEKDRVRDEGEQQPAAAGEGRRVQAGEEEDEEGDV